MKKKTIKQSIFIFSMFIILVILISNLFLLSLINDERNNIYNKSVINNIRIKVKPSLDMAKKVFSSEGNTNALNAELEKDSLKLILLNLNGHVIYCSQGLDAEINSFDESLYMDNSFLTNNKKFYKIAFPIVTNQSQMGNAIFYINTAEVYKDRDKYIKTATFMIIGEVNFLLIIICIFYLILRNKVIKPLNSLKKAAERIKNGDYNFHITHCEDEVGQFAGAFEFMRDEINESIKLQNYLEKNRKELIAAISHDIRTPVATISAHIEAINSGVAKDEKRLAKYLDIIYKKGVELKKLTEDLFIHSQIDVDNLNINKVEIYFKDFIDRLLEPIILEIENLGMSLIVKTEIPDIIVEIDPKRMSQVFLNIIDNSKKYSKNNGHIFIYFRAIESKIEVMVEDDGIGIKPEDMPYIFQKFYRGEKSRNKAYGGAGLGLSICKSIVEAHGGEIKIQSSDLTGTKVFFNI